MIAWRWVREDVVYAIHDVQLAEHGGLSGGTDAILLNAALDRTLNLAAYGEPDAAALAACYAFGLARNHPFADGNERTGWVVARLFLSDNGYRLRFDPADAVLTMASVAAGTVTESALAAWFRQRILKP